MGGMGTTKHEQAALDVWYDHPHTILHYTALPMRKRFDISRCNSKKKKKLTKENTPPPPGCQLE